ncbi:MAG: hypothetical protein IKR04_01465 [Clostridia bacterium]|nr:hypothetical protein [Clostridia bacterium]
MKIFKYILTFGALILIYNLLMYLVCLFPSEIIKDNCINSTKIMLEEGGINRVLTPFTNMDNYTDALIINEAYSIDNEDAMVSYLKMRKNYNKEYTTIQLPDKENDLVSYQDNSFDKDNIPIPNEDYNTMEEFLNFVDGKVNVSVDYGRYYHGYMLLYRPLLICFDIVGIRTVYFIILLILCFFVGIEIKKKFNLITLIAYISILFSFEYLLISYSLEMTPIFLITMIEMLVLLNNIEKIDFKSIYYGAFIVGSLACFFDFFTVPTLTLTLPIFTYVLYLVKNKKYDTKELFIKTFFTCILWSIGYSLTWLSKWIISDILINTNILNSAMAQIGYRGMSNPNSDKDYYLIFVKHFFLSGAIVIALILILDCLKSKIECEITLNNKLILTFICLIPFAWSILTIQHFVRHSIFSYRDFIIIFIFAFLLLYEKLFKTNKRNKKH